MIISVVFVNAGIVWFLYGVNMKIQELIDSNAKECVMKKALLIIAFVVASWCSDLQANSILGKSALSAAPRTNFLEIQKGFEAYQESGYLRELDNLSESDRQGTLKGVELDEIKIKLPLTINIVKLYSNKQSIPVDRNADFVLKHLVQNVCESNIKLDVFDENINIEGKCLERSGLGDSDGLKKVYKGEIVKGAASEDLDNLEKVYPRSLIKFDLQKDDYEINFGNIVSLKDLINKYYHDQGYYGAYAFLPPQKFQKGGHGEVLVYVTEPFINCVTIVRSQDKKQDYNKCSMSYSDKLVEVQDGNLENENIQISSKFALEGPIKTPFKRSDLEKSIIQVERMAGYKDVSVFVRPMMTTVEDKGASFSYMEYSDVEITYAKRKWLASMTYDNMGNRYIGPNMLMGNVDLYDVLGGGEKLNFSATEANDGSTLRYWHIGGSVPLSNEGLLHDFEIIGDWHTSLSRPGYTMKKFDVVNDLTEVSAGVRWHFWRGRFARAEDWNQNPQSDDWFRETVVRSYTGDSYLDALYQDTSSRTYFFNDTPIYEDEVRALTVKATFEGNGRLRLLSQFLQNSEGTSESGATGPKWEGVRENYESLLSVSWTHGVDWGGATQKGALLSTVPEAEPGFQKYNLAASGKYQIRNVPDFPWSTFVSAAVDGQLSDQPLYSSQRIAIGNRNGLRGFGPAELLGDSGLGIRTEVGLTRLFGLWPWSVDVDPEYEHIGGERKRRDPVAVKVLRGLQSTTAFSAYLLRDWGFVWKYDSDSMATKQDSATASSYGFGLRMQNEHGLTITGELAKPVNYTPDHGAAPKLKDRTWRPVFSIGLTSGFLE